MGERAWVVAMMLSRFGCADLGPSAQPRVLTSEATEPGLALGLAFSRRHLPPTPSQAFLPLECLNWALGKSFPTPNLQNLYRASWTSLV